MEQEIQTAIDWWLAAMDNPKHDAGDDNLNRMMNIMVPKQPLLSDEQKRKFSEYLKENIPNSLSTYSQLLTLAVDYGPDEFLNNAAIYAGINNAMPFPIKTVMWIKSGEVAVRHGYSVSTQVIYSK